jgi:hypothetical protein
MRHQLVSFFRCGVEADRVIDIVLHRKQQFGFGAIHRGRRGKEKMLAIVVPASFQHVHKTFDVRIDLGVGVLQRISNTRLRREMDDYGKPALSEEHLCCVAICQVEPYKGEIGFASQDIYIQACRYGNDGEVLA